MPSVFQEFNYEYLVLNRVGDSWKDALKLKGDMLFQLETPDSLGVPTSLLTHVLPIHYEPENYQ